MSLRQIILHFSCTAAAPHSGQTTVASSGSMSLSVSQFLSCSAIARVTRNPKNQILNPKSASRTDSSFGEQTPKRQFSKLVAGCLSSFGHLRFVWSLELGIWDL